MPEKKRETSLKGMRVKMPNRILMNEQELINPVNAEFFKKFHDDVVRSGRAVTENGKTTTMRIVGVEVNGKEYLLPSFDPQTGKVINDYDKLVDKYMPDIKAGRIKGYDDYKQAERDRKIFYPQIVGKQ